MVERINQLLRGWSRPPLISLGQLYWDADLAVMITLAELDHFGPRQDARYWGVVDYESGEQFEWPSGSRPRVFCYLRPSSGLLDLFRLLTIWKFPTVVYSPTLDERISRQFTSSTLRFMRQPLDMRQVNAECDLAILNTNHNTLAPLLLAGKPALLLPPQLEQYLLFLRMHEQGFGEFANPSDPREIEVKLRQMLENDRYVRAITDFASRYRTNDPRSVASKIVAELIQLRRSADRSTGVRTLLQTAELKP